MNAAIKDKPELRLLGRGNANSKTKGLLSRDAQCRLAKNELPPDGAPEFSYYLNYNGLDRYNRQGVTFTFNRATKQFHYDGVTWREILRRYPNSPEAAEARKRTVGLVNINAK